MLVKTIFILTIVAIYFILKYININVSFIGKDKKFKIIFMMILSIFFAAYIGFIVMLISNTNTILDTIQLFMCIVIIISIYSIFAIYKIIKTLGERALNQSTIINCYIKRHTLFFVLKGISIQNTKNSFVLVGKDKFDIYNAMFNGVNTFNICYFKFSNRIESITLMPNGLSNYGIQEIVNKNLEKQRSNKRLK